jgi:hypothetical protein
MSASSKWWGLWVAAAFVAGLGGVGCKSASSEAKKEVADDDEDEPKKKKKKKKSNDDEGETSGDAPKKADSPSPSEPSAPSEPSTPTGPSFAGLYRSTWGDARFRQSGNSVTATYPGGTLDCTAIGADLDCNWKDSAGIGKAKLARLANGDIDGTWGMGASASGGGRWLFKLLSAGDPGPTGNEAAAGSFAGVYQSTWGDTRFVEDSDQVKGTYPGGVLECAATGAKLDCTWREGSTRGRAQLTRQLNGDISGTWGNGESSTNGGTWLFRKK